MRLQQAMRSKQRTGLRHEIWLKIRLQSAAKDMHVGEAPNLRKIKNILGCWVHCTCISLAFISKALACLEKEIQVSMKDVGNFKP